MKIQFLLLALGCTIVASAQLSGTAYYQSKTTIDMNNFGRPGMSEDQKRMIADRMKPYLEKTYILDFKDHESLYKEEEKLELEGSGRMGMMMGSFTPGDQYKNSQTNQVLEEREFFGKLFLVNDTITNLDWTVTKESKMIGQYLVIKAEANMNLDANDWQFLRRRRSPPKEEQVADSIAKEEDPMDAIEVPKQILVTAWFSPQIPVATGPGAYGGLPGLIMELNTGRTTVLCSKLVLNPEKEIVIEVPNKGDEVSREAYNRIVKEKTEEMRENFRGRGGRGGGRRPGG